MWPVIFVALLQNNFRYGKNKNNDIKVYMRYIEKNYKLNLNWNYKLNKNLKLRK